MSGDFMARTLLFYCFRGMKPGLCFSVALMEPVFGLACLVNSIIIASTFRIVLG